MNFVWYYSSSTFRNGHTFFVSFWLPHLPQYYIEGSMYFWITVCSTILHIYTLYQTNLLLTLIIWLHALYTQWQSKKHQPQMRKISNLFFTNYSRLFFEDLVEPSFNIQKPSSPKIASSCRQHHNLKYAKHTCRSGKTNIFVYNKIPLWI